MIGNLLNVLVGLWLAYSAIFANPAGAMNNVALAAAAVAVIVLAVWATADGFLSLAKRNKHRARCVAARDGGGALADWRGAAGLVLDYPARRHRGRHYGDVVFTLSASNDSVCHVFVRSRSNLCAICSVAEATIAAGRVSEGAGRKTVRLADRAALL